ncbi:hypothetical protein D0Y65_035891 [Glycine soja]|uniref:Uncharacterized protein n=1 Tax=Glycine soja TaxID=3848 RepID=A0A445HC08_GLYSO|nr:hypothetical protein D0Y65_035891 [Glycine soja]
MGVFEEEKVKVDRGSKVRRGSGSKFGSEEGLGWDWRRWWKFSFDPKIPNNHLSSTLFILLPLQFSMADQPKFHPALTITNVKSLIPITLDVEHGMYHSWAALFKVLVRIHDLHHHIISPTEAQEVIAYAASKALDPTLWKRLDAAMLQWIYGTISTDLLHAILLKDDTAQGAWAQRTIKNRLAKEGNSDNRSQAALLTSTDSHHGTDNNTSASSASSHQNSKGNKQKKSNSKVSGKSLNSNGKVALQQSELMPFNWQQQPWAAWAPWLAQWPNPPPCPYPASS